MAAAAYGDNANYVLYNKQTFQQIEDYGAAHGWSTEQIQAKKIEFKEKVADASLSQWSANNSIEFIQSNGELSDTVTGSPPCRIRRWFLVIAPVAFATTTQETSNTAKPIRGWDRPVMMVDLQNSKRQSTVFGHLVRNLLSYQRQGIDTVNDIINRWAPPSDNNDNRRLHSGCMCSTWRDS